MTFALIISGLFAFNLAIELPDLESASMEMYISSVATIVTYPILFFFIFRMTFEIEEKKADAQEYRDQCVKSQ